MKRPVSERLILSLFDFTGTWSQPYVDAGYPVIRWDKQVEGDILTEAAFAQGIRTHPQHPAPLRHRD